MLPNFIAICPFFFCFIFLICNMLTSNVAKLHICLFKLFYQYFYYSFLNCNKIIVCQTSFQFSANFFKNFHRDLFLWFNTNWVFFYSDWVNYCKSYVTFWPQNNDNSYNKIYNYLKLKTEIQNRKLQIDFHYKL